jgi:Pyruvate/2-oxoacid:ferredoxin oxidoreductase delta subunit
MSLNWQRCPSCNVYSAAAKGQCQVKCLECGKVIGEPPAQQTAALLGACASTAMTFFEFDSAHEKLSEAQVVPEASICVQCGMCTYNCPMGIDVRAHAWRGKAIRDSHCLTCSECVNRCPRGVLRFERIPLFVLKS